MAEQARGHRRDKPAEVGFLILGVRLFFLVYGIPLFGAEATAGTLFIFSLWPILVLRSVEYSLLVRIPSFPSSYYVLVNKFGLHLLAIILCPCFHPITFSQTKGIDESETMTIFSLDQIKILRWLRIN